MSIDLGTLVSEQALRSAAVLRAKKVDEKTVSAASAKALELKVKGEIEDGWLIAKRNKRSVRMERKKPEDRQLEDDVWTLFYRMGFTELNQDRQFYITMKDGSKRQLDVFAKDPETVFIVECTHSQDSGPKSVKGILDKIEAFREDVIKAVHEAFGKEPRLKVKFALASRKFDIRPADRERAQHLKIPILVDEDLDYFAKLSSLLKSASRYQFLGRYLRGEKVDGLRTKVPATRGRVGDTTFYNFLISPHDLLRIAYINHKGLGANEDVEETYQRMVKMPRLKSIGKYIDDGGTFPTNIVINIKQDNLHFDVKETFGNTTTGVLDLPGQYGSAWVIDGQHRLYGYAYAGRAPKDDKSVVSVLAYEDLPVRKEIEMFVDINTQQVKVPRNLVNEIISTLDIEDEDPRKRLDAMCARIVLGLGERKGSPVNGRIQTIGQTKNNFQCLTLTSFADGIDENSLLGRVHKAGKKAAGTLAPGPLGTHSLESSDIMKKAGRALSGYLNIFAGGAPEHWALGDAKGGYLCTNLGLRSLLVVFRKLIAFAEKGGVRAVDLSADDIVELIKPYAQHIVDYFKNASPDHIARFRNRGSSLKSVSENAFQMLAIIGEGDAAFDDKEVRDYLAQQDVEGTRKARTWIDEINEIVFNDVVQTLKEEYPGKGDSWWLNGVPRSIRNDADKRFNDEDGAHERWQYLMFIDYLAIVQHGDNWELFKDRYNFYGKGQKATLVRWIRKINDCRKITHHAEKGPLSHEQVDFVRRVHELVKKHIRDGELVDGKTQILFDDRALQPGPETAEAA